MSEKTNNIFCISWAIFTDSSCLTGEQRQYVAIRVWENTEGKLVREDFKAFQQVHLMTKWIHYKNNKYSF